MNLMSLKHGDILWCKGLPVVMVAVSQAKYVNGVSGRFTATIIVYREECMAELIFQGKDIVLYNDKGEPQCVAPICDEKSLCIRPLWEATPVPKFDEMIEEAIRNMP